MTVGPRHLIFGTGAIGLAVLEALRRRGEIANSFGAVVTGVASTAKLDAVRALGADHDIDYTHEDVTDSQHHYDVILDTGGNRRLSRLRRALTPTGRLVIVGGETDGRRLGGSDRQVRAQALSPFVSQHLGTFVASRTPRTSPSCVSASKPARSLPPSTAPIRSSRPPRPSVSCWTGRPAARSSSSSSPAPSRAPTPRSAT
jgi:NADPH:quinone reductase-like Zn-dependent oxidoreductase